jgi:putative addiction module component (TIGR02574 family)
MLKRFSPYSKAMRHKDKLRVNKHPYATINVADIRDSSAEEANANPEVLPLSRQLRDELDRRVAEHDADPSHAVPMAEVMERIRARLRDR